MRATSIPSSVASSRFRAKLWMALVDGIRYQKLGDQHVYAQALFKKEELTGYLRNMLMDTQKSIYEHVVETKSSRFTDDLRDKESAKIECGKAHFPALGVDANPARYVVARSVNDLLAETASGPGDFTV